MAEITINDYNTLPEQVQINKDDIKTNTADITKLKDDISKINLTEQYYLKKTDASNVYLTKQEYNNRYDTGEILLTVDGFNKIKNMAEKVGTTITLMVTTDFIENVQPINVNELLLNVFAGSVKPIYRNIHLMPNQTIDDYDALQNSQYKTWYSGHAVLILPSRNFGRFAISYQKGNMLILTLTTHL